MPILAQVRGSVTGVREAEQALLQQSGLVMEVPQGWAPAVGEEVSVQSMPSAANGRLIRLDGGPKGKATVKARAQHARMHMPAVLQPAECFLRGTKISPVVAESH